MQRNHWTFLRCWHFGCYSLSGRSKPQRDCRVFVHCSASGENRRPARLRWKRWRSLDGSGSFYTWKRSDSVTHSDHSGDGHEWTRETQQSWTPCCCLFTYTHCSQHTHTFSPTNEAFRTPPIRPAQHRCDKGSDWVTFHSITARLPASTAARP